MKPFKIHHTARENTADLAVQIATILLLGGLMLRHGPVEQRWPLLALTLAGLVFAPLLWLAGPWVACAVTLGVLSGYLLYSLTHLAIHRSTARNQWLRRRQLWHAEHHHGTGLPGRYGVTTRIWDRLFAMSGKPGPQADAS